MGLSETTHEAFRGDIPGGGYRAEADNTGEYWTIRDVPFFSELPAGVRSNKQPIGKEWMEATILRHKQLENDQKHLPPVHANHHDTGRENFRIGFLRPTRVEQVVIDGKGRWTLFGDIVHIETHHYNRIKDLGYPYRSAEIGSGWSPEIASLALSEDEAPHFKLPMLTIGDEVKSFDREFEPENSPAVAFAEVGDSSFVCFSFKGITMAPKKAEKPKTTVTLKEDPSKHDPDEEKMDDTGKKIAEVVETFFRDKLPAVVETILQGLLPPVARTDEGEQTVDPAMLKATTEKDAERMAELAAKDNERTAELMAKVAALEDKDRQRTQAEKLQLLVEKQTAALKEEGWQLSGDTEAAMRDIAAASDAALEKFVAEYKKNTPKDPPKTLDDVQVFKEELPELQKYRTQSPEVLTRALALSGQFDDYHKMGGTSSREEFIDINLESAEAV